MTEATRTASDNEAEPSCGYVGRIPVRNLWLLLLYASDLFLLRSQAIVNKEKNPDDLPDLVAEILSHAVETRQRRQLSLGYRRREAALSRVRGRIDVLATERRRLLARGLVACRFDDLTVDTPRNRFVRSALEVISRLVRHELARRCRKLAIDMKTMGVAGSPPSHHQMRSDRFGWHDKDDRYMVAAAKLAFDLALPTEVSGNNMLPLPEREEQWVRRLFERAVGGFYRVVLSSKGWRVSPGSALAWQIGEESTPGVKQILPSMKTDIVLNHRSSGRRIVIDTKFTSILKTGWHDNETLSSPHLYQIYAYLRSQVGQGDSSADRAEGVLLYPSIGENVDETAVIQGHRFRFMTVDLTADTSIIRSELLRVILD